MAMQIPPGADLSKIPAGKPPPGDTSNLVNPPNLQGTTIGVTVAAMVLSVLFAGLSFSDRVRHMKAADYMLFVGLVLTLAYSIVSLTFSDKEVHQWDLPLSVYFDAPYLKKLFVQNILLGPTFFTVKAAILLVYLQLFSVKAPFRTAVYAGFVLDVIAYIPQLALAPIFCAPHAGHAWNFQVPQNCGHLSVWGIPQSTLGTVLDLELFFLPIPIVTRLSMSRRKKLAVLGVFATAILGVVASVISLAYRIKLVKEASDSNYYSSVVILCNIVEVNIAVIVGSTPGCASLLRIAVESRAFSTMQSRLLTIFARVSSGSGSRQSRRQAHSMPFEQGQHGDSSYAQLRGPSENHELRSLSGKPGSGWNGEGPPQDRIVKVVDIEQHQTPRDSG